MRLQLGYAILLAISCLPPAVLADDALGLRPLHPDLKAAVDTLPPHTHLLLDRDAIERFLVALDGTPPDWVTVYGQGHHDPEHDERLFALNRERDARREKRPALQWAVAFLWHGELSQFDGEAGGFAVALGPKFTATGWGDVRFKHEDLPARLIALTGEETSFYRQQLSRGLSMEVDVLMTGHLIPEESVIYDFSHEHEGRGLIMPVVRIEAVEFALTERSRSRD